MSENKYSTNDSLLLGFNERKDAAFSDVYMMYFDELHRFAQRLFYSTGTDVEDLVQDIFVTVWSNPKITFISIDHVKNYIYTSIKNKHKDFLKHKLHKDKYEDVVKSIDDYHFSQMIENEVITLLTLAENVLTQECAKVLRLYLEGYDANEIASQLGKSQHTVYHQRLEAISTLKKYFTKNNISYFLTFFQII